MTNTDLAELTTVKVVVLGEVLWDLVGDERFLGGAPLNFAFHLRALGHEPVLISAVGYDELGAIAVHNMEERGISARFIGRTNTHPTGTVTVNLGRDGLPEFAIHRPAAYDIPSLTAELRHELFNASPQWIYFGTLQQMSPEALRLTLGILEELKIARKFYDVNLRPNSYTPELIGQLAPAHSCRQAQ